MFRIYTEEQIGKLYLSPYTDVRVDEEQIVIRQSLFHCIVSLKGTPEDTQQLLQALETGVEEKELLDFFCRMMPKEDAVKTMEVWLRTGVLE